jgi:Phosphotransferase enzyme family
MAVSSFQFPNRGRLHRGLMAIFNGHGAGYGRLTRLRREPSFYTTSFPCEIVRCWFENGRKLTLFCKYETKDDGDPYGQRGGVPYEAKVYRHVLQASAASTPAFYGAFADRETGGIWLVLEYVTRSRAVGKASLEAMSAAARWIGQFQSVHAARTPRSSNRFLTVYDAAYYQGWARRTAQFAGRLHRQFPWLRPLCKRWEEAAVALATWQPTIIHGEYYPHNILVQRGQVRPVDWETAAIAAGEIDLATLTEGWSRAIGSRCERAYQRARWPGGPPADFPRILDLARVYVQLRWLGDQPQWTAEKGSLERFSMLRLASERLGLI